MKRVYITTALTCLVILALLAGYLQVFHPFSELSGVKVGFIYDNDESTAYTYNFSLAAEALQKKYGAGVEFYSRSNVPDDKIEEPLRELAAKGCNVIFLNGYSEQVISLAEEYPSIQFCQTSYMDMTGVDTPANYHSFKGEAYQGRYVSGIVAGMKLKEMIDGGLILPGEAVLGFVAAFPSSEVISGYTAFLPGARSVAPQATMRVRYTGTWSSYSREKSAAKALLDEGCLIISQHSDTIAPAVACEEEAGSREKPVYYVGYNQVMSEVTPTTSLVTTRINWEPYVLSAVEAVIRQKAIETVVPGKVHGTDMSAGFDRGWVEMLELNQQLAAPGTREAMDSAIEQFRRGNGGMVFRGDYTGVDPDNPLDTCDLREGYEENATSSFPTFHYILKDIIFIDP